MAVKDRLKLIQSKILIDNKVVVSELSAEFGVTEETIRRDLEKLENEGILTRTFGGAVLNMAAQMGGIHFYKRAATHLAEKKMMAEAFRPFLRGKTTIAADASSTVMEALKLLDDSQEITVLTTSTEIFRELAHTNINVISTGGVYQKSALSLQGQVAKDNIKKYHVDIVLLGCKGLDLEMGATDSIEGEANVKKVMREQGTEAALFVDHSKFDRKAFTRLLDWNEIDYLVTDQKPEEKWVQVCEENKIKLVYPADER